MDYASELLKNKTSVKQGSQAKLPVTDYASALMSDGPAKTMEAVPLNSVMTPEGTGNDPASFGTHFKAGFVDDPKTQIKIYSAARFPDLPEEEREKRYGIHDGGVVYLGDDGKVYRETPDTFMQKTKTLVAQEGSRLPNWVLGILGGIFGGIPGAGVGAGTGEAIRKGVGAAVFDEPIKPGEIAKDVAVETVFGAGGEAGGRIVGKLANKALAKRGGRIVEVAGRDMPTLNVRGAQEARSMGQRYGIDLLPPSTTESQELISRFNLLGDLPRTANKVQAARRATAEQVDDAVYRFLDDFAPSNTNSLTAGQKLTKAAQEVVEDPVRVRRAKAKPLYEKAFQDAPEVDITPVVSWIDDKLVTAKGDVRRGLLKAKETLLKPDLPKKTTPSGLLDAQGNPIISDVVGEFDTSLKGLHDAKMAIDAAMSKAARTSSDKTIQNNYREIKNLLLKQMDDASPDYSRARQVFSEFSEEVDKQAGKTLTGQISKLKDDDVINAHRRLLSSVMTSPETVSKARAKIYRKNPEAWNDALRVYMQDAFEAIKGKVTGETPNLGGWMYKNMWGNTRQRNIMKAAMTEQQFKNLGNFMEVLRRTGLIFGKESTTATRQVALEGMKRDARAVIANALKIDVTKPGKQFAEAIDNALFERYQEQVIDAMLSEKAANQLSKLRQLKPGTQKFLGQLGIFMGLLTSGKFSQDAGRISEEITPPAMLQTQGNQAQTQGRGQ